MRDVYEGRRRFAGDEPVVRKLPRSGVRHGSLAGGWMHGSGLNLMLPGADAAQDVGGRQ